MRNGWKILVPSAGVLLLAVLPYLAGGVSREFITLDDDIYIYNNAQVRKGLTGETLRWALTTTEHANWYPLRRLSHLADVTLFGLDARAHHLVSLGWHAAAALLLFLALARATGSRRRSFVVAGLFAAHPVQVESVAWAAERSNVQAGFFLALSLLLYERYVRRPGPGRYGALLAACLLGLAAKPVLLILPFLLLLLDFWPFGRLTAPSGRLSPALLGRRLLEKAPLLPFVLASGAIAVLAHRFSGAVALVQPFPPGVRLGNALLSYARYLGKLLWPADLAVFYPHPGASLPWGAVAAAGALVAALTALALLAARRRPWLAAGWLWYAGALLPMSGIVPFGGQAMADRFLYLPAIGLFLALVWGAAEAVPAAPLRTRLLGLAAGAVLAALAAAGARQVGYWRSSETLFVRSLAITGPSALIHANLGGLYRQRGAYPAAEEQFRKALALSPGGVVENFNYGELLVLMRRSGESLPYFRRVLELAPGNTDAHYYLGVILAREGDPAEAARHLRAALRNRPADVVIRATLARLEGQSRR